jgi:methyltransferase (TIGR00027 family)
MYPDRPSRTALKVALSIVTLGAKPGMNQVLPPGIVEATRRLLVASGVVSKMQMMYAESRQMVWAYEAFDWMLPGQFEAFAWRKAFFERQVRAGIEAGATQILVLGAGYDTLGWRLSPKFRDVKFFEMDHPATAGLKARGIDAMGRRDNLILISEDLSQQKISQILQGIPSWDPRRRSIVLAEGLVMYLPPGSVRELFCQCAEITGVGSRLAFTYIPAAEDGRPDAGRWSGLMLWFQKASGEPWIWTIRPEALGRFLEETGWTNDSENTDVSVKHGVEFFVAAKKLEPPWHPKQPGR